MRGGKFSNINKGKSSSIHEKEDGVEFIIILHIKEKTNKTGKCMYINYISLYPLLKFILQYANLHIFQKEVNYANGQTRRTNYSQ